MVRFALPVSTLALLTLVTSASAAQDPQPVGAGITPPRLVHSVQPGYTSEARRAGVQGIVLVGIVISERGLPTEITLISPLGFGLDERAIAAIRQWRFKPATREGKPVPVYASIEVSFRFPGAYFNSKAERRRTAYNRAIRDLASEQPKIRAAAAAVIEKLAREKFVAAMYVLGVLHKSGRFVPQDDAKAEELIRFAAEKNYGPAMFEVAQMDLGKDREKALQLMRDAAVLGSSDAQNALGKMYEKGDGVEQDVERARRYYRLCAAQRNVSCQMDLARMILDDPARRERDTVQGIAWYMLAASAGNREAAKALETEIPKLTPEQLDWAKKLAPQLIGRR